MHYYKVNLNPTKDYLNVELVELSISLAIHTNFWSIPGSDKCLEGSDSLIFNSTLRYKRTP